MRSKVMHEEWIKTLPIEVIRIEEELKLMDLVYKVINENPSMM
jgi:hypothetical protein